MASDKRGVPSAKKPGIKVAAQPAVRIKGKKPPGGSKGGKN